MNQESRIKKGEGGEGSILLMMVTDDELELSASDPARIESSAKARRKALEWKMKEQNLEKKADSAAADKSKLKLDVLKKRLEVEKDEKTKKDQQRKEKTGSSFQTMTREQEISAAKLTADTTFNPDKLVQQGKQEEAVKKERQKEEIQQESTS